mmetsp:Transcript_4051/g.8684  ORF Transcript_4051/g.8684 Transcript_4051/m.8684 type:complete len:96 (-) Transcript_4051:391-678(-)
MSNTDGPFGDFGNIGVGFSDTAILAVSLVGFCFLGFSKYAATSFQEHCLFPSACLIPIRCDDLQLCTTSSCFVSKLERRSRKKTRLQQQIMKHAL